MKKIATYWWSTPCEDMMNFGDRLTPYLLEKLLPAGEIGFFPVTHRNRARLLVIGTLLQDTYPNRAMMLLGTGLFYEMTRVFKNARAYAVRGPLTRRCLGLGEETALGDMGILARDVFGEAPRSGKIGILVHHSERHLAGLQRFKNDPGYLYIDVCRDAPEVVREIASCSAIVSSSLHGLVIADAYHIPNKWLKLSDFPAFKYNDYFASIGRSGEDSLSFSLEDVPSFEWQPIGYIAGIESCKAGLRAAVTRMVEDIRNDGHPFELDDCSLDRHFTRFRKCKKQAYALISQLAPWPGLRNWGIKKERDMEAILSPEQHRLPAFHGENGHSV